MTNNDKIAPPPAQLGLLLRLIGLCFLLMFVMGLLGGSLPRPIANTTLKLLQMATTLLLFGIPAFIYARLSFPQNPLFHLGFRPAHRTNFYVLGILLLLFAFPLEGWLGLLNRQLPLPAWTIKAEDAAEQQLKALLVAKNSFDIVFNLVVVAIIPGIFEEMFFRGVVQRLLTRITRKPWLSICIAAAIFSFMHFEFLGFLPRFFLGILLGALFWYSGSLWTCVLAHCLFNGIQVLALNYMPEVMDNKNPSIPAYSVLLSLAIVIILLVVMRRQFLQWRAAEDNSLEWH